MMNVLAIGLGGALGAMARYGVGIATTRVLSSAFPYGTLGINIIGCLIMGLLIGVFALREPVDPMLKLFWTTGILGGFTTFSAFSLEAIMLYDRKPTLAAAYVLTSVFLSIGACAIGLKVMAR
ncbi:MAG TPA: fluoride efflux transporter CrcB [Alphaproteobacteria bacterium]